MNKANNQYNFIKELGHGGNGTVYLVEDKITKQQFALKKLKLKKRASQKQLQRFKDEISIVTTKLVNNLGVLPICNYYIQTELNKADDYSWYSMPVAQSLSKYVFKDINSKITAFLQLTKTLESLHKQDITHRDIKPDNLYFYNGNFVFSDFGLTDFPHKTAKTSKKERIGPWLTIAPEMERDSNHADYKAADIYSFAKTLWIILTNDYNCFEGQYSYTTEYMDLSKYIKTRNEYDNSLKIYLAPLHELLFKCTSNKPEERLNAKEIVNYLNAWLIFSKDHAKGDSYEWQFLKKRLFNIPLQKCSWNTFNEIYNVLELVTRTPYLNHTFFPGRGGLYLNNVSKYADNLIEFDFNGAPYIGKPKLLEFHSFDDSLFNYFYLELDNIEDFYEFPPKYKSFEISVCELSKEKFVEHWYLNYKGQNYNKISVPDSAREVVLLNKGVYVIFCQSSPYNIYDSQFGFDSYSAYQIRFNTSEKFEKFINLFHNEFWLFKMDPSKDKLEFLKNMNNKLYPPQKYLVMDKKLKSRQNEALCFLKESKFYSSCNYNNSCEYNYYLETQIDSKNYVFTIDNQFIAFDQSFNLSEAFEKQKELELKEKSIKLFSDKNDVYNLIRHIKRILKHHFKKDFNMPPFYLCGKFISLPSKRYFTENDLKNAYLNGDDLSNLFLVIKPDLTVTCINSKLINEGTRGLYFYIDSDLICVHDNICGNKNLSQLFIKEKYKELLARTSVKFKALANINTIFELELEKNPTQIITELENLHIN